MYKVAFNGWTSLVKLRCIILSVAFRYHVIEPLKADWLV